MLLSEKKCYYQKCYYVLLNIQADLGVVFVQFDYDLLGDPWASQVALVVRNLRCRRHKRPEFSPWVGKSP